MKTYRISFVNYSWLWLVLLVACSPDQTTVDIAMIGDHSSVDSLVLYDPSASPMIQVGIGFANEDGKSKITIHSPEETRYKLFYYSGENVKTIADLFLKDGQQTTVTFEVENPIPSLIISGPTSPNNLVLASIAKIRDKLNNAIRSPLPQDSFDTMLATEMKQATQEIDNSSCSEAFKEMAKEELNRFKDVLAARYEKNQYKLSLIGQKGNDFTFQDASGNQIDLSDFEGKYLYIDVWATWCKPCIKEHPYLRQLEEDYANNNNLEIISISIDSKIETWQKYVEREQMEGIQLYNTNPDFISFYELRAIPRFLLLDKTGAIISHDEKTPSDPELRKTLDGLL